jgi:hypothetical protein
LHALLSQKAADEPEKAAEPAEDANEEEDADDDGPRTKEEEARDPNASSDTAKIKDAFTRRYEGRQSVIPTNRPDDASELQWLREYEEQNRAPPPEIPPALQRKADQVRKQREVLEKQEENLSGALSSFQKKMECANALSGAIQGEVYRLLADAQKRKGTRALKMWKPDDLTRNGFEDPEGTKKAFAEELRKRLEVILGTATRK